MKNLKTLAIYILAAAFLSSCGGVNKMVKESELVGYNVTPDVLVDHQVADDQDVRLGERAELGEELSGIHGP